MLQEEAYNMSGENCWLPYTSVSPMSIKLAKVLSPVSFYNHETLQLTELRFQLLRNCHRLIRFAHLRNIRFLR